MNPKKVFEIGTYRGASTVLIASQASHDTIVYTLDLPKTSYVYNQYMTDISLIKEEDRITGSLFVGSKFEANIKKLFGDSSHFNFTPYYNSIDLVFIDGSHSFRYVSSDTINAIKMIRPGGVVIWHDYGSMRTEYGVTKYLDGLRKSGLQVFRLGTCREYAIMRVDGSVKERFLKSYA